MGSRDYKKGTPEYEEYVKRQTKRVQARRQLEKEGKVKKGDGKEVNHKKSLISGGGNSKSNLEVTSAKKNRGWRKGKSGYKP